MIHVRKSEERGHFDHGWLDSYHTFSFASYIDPKFMGFRTLRVINEDRVQAGEGFGTHGHRDMEIITYPISGIIAHRDSMGNGSEIHPGEIQYMSAGTGVTHSEFNGSKQEVSHLLQIWILPDRKGYAPAYSQHKISEDQVHNQLYLLASGTGEAGSIRVRQDVRLYASHLDPYVALEFKPENGRSAWVQIVRGSLRLNKAVLHAGDGAAVIDERLLKMKAGDDGAEFLLFDLN